ncbi:MAG: ECF transporter S component [Armatimonadota bacterium]|nr:ECF transporter S component [Armatimonadota bacterium]MDR5697342.1 ECF transporter S component [Armatimonadota bacterium]
MSTRQLTYGAIFAALYVVIGQFVTQYLPNPMIPGAVIALNMTVVVIAGILFGPAVGGMVGLVGTAVNFVLTPTAAKPFEGWAILPHTAMGAAAGLARNAHPVLASLTILVGHALNVLFYVATGLLPLRDVIVAGFVVGLGFETIVDVGVIVAAVYLLRPWLQPRG